MATIFDQIKRSLKTVLPAPALARLRRIRARRAEHSVQGLSVAETFDKIYRNGYWGNDYSSGDGSYGPWAEGFVRTIQELIQERQIRTITDIGCGDFNVGSQLAPLVESYRALDVSSVILDRNRSRFGHLTNVTFAEFNVIEQVPEPTDLIFVRQVLQHLSNEQVSRALDNLEASRAGCIVIAEDVVPGGEARANIDLDQQSVGTRANFGSGLFLERPPFNRRFRALAEIPSPTAGQHNILRITELTGRIP